MSKQILIYLLLLLLLNGCRSEPEIPKITKVINIEIVAVGGFGNPNAIRIWHLEDGRIVSMGSWMHEDIAIGDYVYYTARYRRWQKLHIELELEN